MANADFNIVIKANPGQAKSGLGQVEGKLRGVEKQANKTQRALKQALGGAALGQGIVQATRFLANFSQEMSTVKAISGATANQFDEMRESAINLGTTTRFTATQAASGMLFLARSGFKTAQILETIPGVLNLAQAGALDLGRAADITTNILKGFGLATSQTSRVVDVLALASNSANTNVEQMGQAMKFVAPIAAGVNMSLENTAAAIQVLSNAGLQASMAGTGLRRVIGALEGPTTSQQKILARLGLTVDDVKVSQVGLTAALAALRSKTNDAGISLGLFGQRGGPAAIVMGKLTEEMEKFGTANLNAAGTAERIAAIMDDNLNGAILRVKSAFQGLLILWGDVEGVSVLRSVLEAIAKTFRFIARNAEGFNDAMKIVTVSLIIFTAATNSASAGLAKLRLAIASNPLGVLIIIVTALTAGLALMKDELTLGTNGIVTFGEIFRVTIDFINDAWMSVTGGMGGDFIDLSKGWKGLMDNMANLSLAMVITVIQGFDKIVGFMWGVEKSAKLISESWFQLWDFAFINMANGANKSMQKAIKWFVDGYNKLADVFNLGDAFKIDDVAFTEPLAQLEGDAIVTIEKIQKAFSEGMSFSEGEKVIMGILDEAERRTLERMKRLGQKAPVEEELKPETQDIFGPKITAGGRSGPSFAELMKNIERETELLKLNSREMEIQQGLFQFQEQLGRGLIAVEKELVTSALVRLQQQKEMAAVYDEIKQPMEDVLAQQQALNSLYLEGRIAVEEYQIAMDKLKITQFELGTTISDGLGAGLLKIKQSIQDVSGAAENTLVNAFRGAEEALVDFTTTGEINFSQFVDGILKDMTRLLLRQALLSAIPGLGPAAGALPGIPTIASAQGNDFMVGGSGGTDSQSALMKFTPGERVTVQTPAQQGASQSVAPIINIYNVSDPSDVPINSREGEQSIINIITKNRNAVNNGLAGS